MEAEVSSMLAQLGQYSARGVVTAGSTTRATLQTGHRTVCEPHVGISGHKKHCRPKWTPQVSRVCVL